MIACIALVVAPIILALSTPAIAVLSYIGASPAVSASAPDMSASHADSWLGREVDRRGRILPRRDARGRFVKSYAH